MALTNTHIELIEAARREAALADDQELSEELADEQHGLSELRNVVHDGGEDPDAREAMLRPGSDAPRDR